MRECTGRTSKFYKGFVAIGGTVVTIGVTSVSVSSYDLDTLDRMDTMDRLDSPALSNTIGVGGLRVGWFQAHAFSVAQAGRQIGTYVPILILDKRDRAYALS